VPGYESALLTCLRRVVSLTSGSRQKRVLCFSLRDLWRANRGLKWVNSYFGAQHAKALFMAQERPQDNEAPGNLKASSVAEQLGGESREL
jgi:hypothetical protein